MSKEKAALVRLIDLKDAEGADSHYKVASLILNRPHAANSFNGDMLISISEELESLAKNPSIRALLLQSYGRHFSAGADLNWMQESAKLSKQDNIIESEKLKRMFEALYNFPAPTIAVVKGAAYGGAVGLVACCDYAVATENAKFCLSEVRVGLLPAVILPYLGRKLPEGDLRRLTLTGKIFTSEEARTNGLIQDTVDSMLLDDWLKRELNHLLLASPQAQKRYKQLQAYLSDHSHQQGSHTVEAIAETRASQQGQNGLESFFNKSNPDWVCRVPDDVAILEI